MAVIPFIRRHAASRLHNIAGLAAMLVVGFVGTAAIGGYALRTAPASAPSVIVANSPPIAARFGHCGSAAELTCVVDGDTFRVGGEIIRIADIDTPETHEPRCAAERQLGMSATARMTALLNAGPFELAPYERDHDMYGRSLRIVVRDGRSIGMTLVGEGLAHRWDGSRHPWC